MTEALPLRLTSIYMGSNQNSEEDWLGRIAVGDRSAFEQLYQKYHRRVFGYLFRMVDRADAAEELTTDVMLEIWKSAKRFRGDSQVSTWIFGIARYKALSWRRKADSRWTDIDEASDVPASVESQDEVLIRGDLRARIRAKLGQLSRKHQEVMELTYYQGFSCEEIAKILGCPRNTVKTRMFHARKQLRALLADEAR